MWRGGHCRGVKIKVNVKTIRWDKKRSHYGEVPFVERWLFVEVRLYLQAFKSYSQKLDVLAFSNSNDIKLEKLIVIPGHWNNNK